MAVNITARVRGKNYVPGVLHTDTFDRLTNGVIFPAEFCVKKG